MQQSERSIPVPIEHIFLPSSQMVVGVEDRYHLEGSTGNGAVARSSRVARRVARPVLVWTLLAACLVSPGLSFFQPVPSLYHGAATVRSTLLVSNMGPSRHRGADAPGLGVGCGGSLNKATGGKRCPLVYKSQP